MQQVWQQPQQQAKPQPRQKMRLGELLVEEQILTAAQITDALVVQKKRHPPKPLGIVCQELGYFSANDLTQFLHKYQNRLLLGELLVHMGLVFQEQIDQALEIQKRTKQKLGTILIEKGWLNENALIKALFRQAQSVQKAAGKFDQLIASYRVTQEQLAEARTEAQAKHCSTEIVLMQKYKISKR